MALRLLDLVVEEGEKLGESVALRLLPSKDNSYDKSLMPELIDTILKTENLLPGQTPLRKTPTSKNWRTIQGIDVDFNTDIPEDRKNFFFVAPDKRDEVIKRQLQRYQSFPEKFNLTKESTLEDAIKVFDKQNPELKIKELTKKGIDTKQKLNKLNFSMAPDKGNFLESTAYAEDGEYDPNPIETGKTFNISDKIGEIGSKIATSEEWQKRKEEILQEIKQIPKGVKGIAKTIARSFKPLKTAPTPEEMKDIGQGIQLVGNLTNEFLWRPLTGWYQSMLKEVVNREYKIDDYVSDKEGFQSLPRAMARGLLGIEDVSGKDILEAGGIPKTEDIVLKHPIIAAAKEVWGGGLDVLPLPVMNPVRTVERLLTESKYAAAETLAIRTAEGLAKAKYEYMGNPLERTWEDLPAQTKTVAIKMAGEAPLEQLGGKSIADVFYEHPYKAHMERIRQTFQNREGFAKMGGELPKSRIGIDLTKNEIVAPIIKKAGAIFRYVSDLKNSIYPGDQTVYFDDADGSTKTLPLSKLTPEAIKVKIGISEAGKAEKVPVIEDLKSETGIVGPISTPKEGPEGGKTVGKSELSPIKKEDLTPEILDRLMPSEAELLTKRVLEGKSLAQTAKEIDALSSQWVADVEKALVNRIQELKNQPVEPTEEEMGWVDEQKDILKSHIKGTLKPELKLKGEYANLKHLSWLFAPEGKIGQEPDTLVSELRGMGFNVENGDDLRELIADTFKDEIMGKAEKSVARMDKADRNKIYKALHKETKVKKVVTKYKRPETLVGRGTVLSQRQDTDRALQQQISSEMPFTLLGNKAEVLSRLSDGIKNELRKDIDLVYDLFGGAKGYRVGLFKNIPSENYNLNEFSDERYNYYKNMQDPAKVEVMKSTIRTLRNELINEISSAFGIDSNKYSPDILRLSLNKWLQRGLLKERYQFAKGVIQHFGNKLLMQAVADGFKSPKSSAIYYFLENTSIFGISKDPQGKYTWTQGIIRTTQDKSTIRDTMARIVDANAKLGTELSRDGKMPLTQMDAWLKMDEITAGVTAGTINPEKTVVLIDPQYLNPTAKEGTYTVGMKDSTWEGHKDNLETHLLPLAKSGVKIIYTNNEDINLNRWLRTNKLPYNVEEQIGVVAERGGRDEIIAFINYKLPKEYTTRVGTSAGGGEPGQQEGYLGEEITGESERFAEWLKQKQELEAMGEKEGPSFGKEWTPQQRKDIYIQALKTGIVFKDNSGKIHNNIKRFISKYPGASYEQIKEYIGLLKGDAQNPPKLPKTTAVVPYEWGGPFNDLTEFQGKPLSGLDPVRAAELVDGKPFGPVRKYIVEPARKSEKVGKVALKAIFDKLDNVSRSMSSDSESSAVLFRYIENRLTPKDMKRMSPIITSTADYIGKIYDSLLSQLNEVRLRIGKNPIPRRTNYITHIQELSLMDSFYQGLSNIPDDAIKNIPAFIKPNSQFFKFALQRLGGPFKEDAIGAFRTYTAKAIPIIYNTADIRQARALCERLPNNAYKYFSQYIDEVMALRPSHLDKMIPRPILTGLSWLRNKMGKGAILGNLSSIMNQPFTLPNITSSSGIKFTCRAMMKVFQPGYREFVELNSDTLHGRIFEIDFDPNLLKKADNALGFLMQAADREMVRIAFGAAYEQAISRGATVEEAIRYADDMAFKTQSGFNKSDLPPAFRSQFFGTFLQFQNTVNNGFNYMKFDMGKDQQGNRTSMGTFKAVLILMGTFLALQKIYDELGLPTPVQDAFDLVPIISIGEYGPPVTYAGPLALLSYFTTHDPYKKAEAASRLKKSAFLFVSGGNQLRKTWEGVEANLKGGKFNKKGKMMFPIKGAAEKLRSLAFGPYQTKAGKEYIRQKQNPGEKSSSRLRLL